MKPIVVVTTAGTQEQAHRLAEELVDRRHAACVNILPIQRSVYRWKGEVCDDSEFLLIVKTADTEWENVKETVRELHDYELPELLAFNIGHGEERFLEWMLECLGNDDEGPVLKAVPDDQPES